MKSVTIITFLVAFVVVGNSMLIAPMPDLKYCQSKTGVIEVHLENVVSNFMNGVSEIRERYCLIACLAKRLKIINGDNSLNFARIEGLTGSVKATNEYKAMPPRMYEKVLTSLKTCSLKVQDHRDDCSVVEYLMQCTMNSVQNHTNAANIANEYGKQ